MKVLNDAFRQLVERIGKLDSDSFHAGKLLNSGFACKPILGERGD